MNVKIEFLSPSVNINRSFSLTAEIKSATQAYCELVAEAADSIPEVIAASKKIESLLITDTASGPIASFPDGADGMPLKSLVINIEPVQAGSGDPSPDNVRPISGWTGANVPLTGFNVWDEEWEVGDINASGANETANDRIRSKNYIPVKSGQTYYFKIGSSSMWLWGYDADKNYVGRLNNTNSIADNTLTIPDGIYYIRFVCRSQYGTTYNHDISINYPATDHNYHAYTGHVYPITWQDSAGTVYGGSLDVGTGALTVTKAKKLLNDPAKWNTFSSVVDFLYDYSFSDRKIFNNSYDGCICSIAPVEYLNNAVYGRWNSVTGRYFGFKNYNGALTLEALQAMATAGDIAICYELATPQIYTLTPEQVVTLLGQNNIWADTGDTEVEYYADTKLYINKIVAALA